VRVTACGIGTDFLSRRIELLKTNVSGAAEVRILIESLYKFNVLQVKS